ncbi:MAG TPA: hypothetical protein VL098_12585 [Flavipsychrobacter sp.]|nr:hypothetical protein [Flavipsychrobacter sp.]
MNYTKKQDTAVVPPMVELQYSYQLRAITRKDRLVDSSHDRTCTLESPDREEIIVFLQHFKTSAHQEGFNTTFKLTVHLETINKEGLSSIPTVYTEKHYYVSNNTTDLITYLEKEVYCG